MATEQEGTSADEARAFAVVDVSDWAAGYQEGMGSKAKVWLRSPSDERWLFKYVRGADDQAEDWSEKVAAAVAIALGIPAAQVELAERNGQRGVISLDITSGRDLIHGNELMYEHDPRYRRDLPRPDRGYTLAAVQAVLADCGTPPGWTAAEWSAYDVFAEYLMFDALIANQDRHHENWAVLTDATGGYRALAPSFDHASSLGFMLTDTDRRARLTTNDRGRSVAHWVTRGRTHFEGRPSLVDLARQALEDCSPDAAACWVTRLRGVDASTWETILSQVPTSRLSDAARIFASEVLSLNRGRLLDACDDLGP